MKKYPWFKHWNDDKHEPGLVALWDEHKLEAIAIYYKLCQFMSRYEAHDARGKARVSWATFSKESGSNVPKLRRLLAEITLKTLGSFQDVSGGFLEFELTNWAKSQEIRVRKTTHKPAKNHSRGEKKEERGERIEERVLSALVGPSFFSGLTPSGISLMQRIKKEESIKAWLDAYNEKFLVQEINRAAQYCIDKNKSYANVAGFLSNWFSGSNNIAKAKSSPGPSPAVHHLPRLEGPMAPEDLSDDPLDKIISQGKGNG
jgi:hypothetical protein